MDIVEMHVVGRAEATRATDVPLVVDLDGTLLKTDLLYEALFLLLATSPLVCLKVPFWLAAGKAAFKARLAAAAVPDMDTLPLDEDVLAMIRRAKAEGRAVYLASASDHRYVDAFARHSGLFDGVFASDGVTNLGGRAKAQMLVAAFGERGFDYVGNDEIDVPVWSAARTAYAADPRPAVLAAARRAARDVRALTPRPRDARTHLRAMRVHQWLKNLLILFPGLAAHVTAPASYGAALLGFLSFSLCASGVYLLNDLIDLRSDRVHAVKRHRPYASGALPLAHALRLLPLLFGGAAALALLVSPTFLAVVAAYSALTLGYSLWIKRILMLDVVMLACLYGVRVAAGGVAFGVVLSEWLVAFSGFLFLSLALVKRATKLVNGQALGRAGLAGRGYRQGDLPVVEMLAAASGFVAVLVLALYISSADVVRLYGRPEALWAGCLILMYWLGRILILTPRGEMHDDPVVFAATDRASLACGALLGLSALAAVLVGVPR